MRSDGGARAAPERAGLGAKTLVQVRGDFEAIVRIAAVVCNRPTELVPDASPRRTPGDQSERGGEAGRVPVWKVEADQDSFIRRDSIL
jgi:hypothetical protein